MRSEERLLKREKKVKELSTEELISNDLMTIPNAISFVRILLITPFVALFISKMYIPAAVVILISGLSDCVDGYIARRFHQESELGKILDPLADKLTLIAVGVCLIFIEPYVLPLMIIMVIKDILMIIGGTIVIQKGIIPPKSVWYGKVSTILFYVSVVTVVLMAILNYRNELLSMILLGVTAAFMIFSLINYMLVFFRILKKANLSEAEKTAGKTSAADET